ncbi:barstar family protein [Gordonia aurantiaca]|uniref:barstar family protein n=1 Tax=Gordonia sp. B21 TaxID=3151852 RepID=UPI0032634856
MTQSNSSGPNSREPNDSGPNTGGPQDESRARALRRFLDAAASGGPAVAVTTVADLPAPGPDARVRTVSGTTATTLGGLYTSFARVWGFPDHFGRNKDAFDDCMRDLDAPDAEGRVPDTIVVHITQAHRLLDDDRSGFDWFAESVDFYRDHYRDAGRGFAVILSTSSSRLAAVRSRWQEAGVAVADLATESSTGEDH